MPLLIRCPNNHRLSVPSRRAGQVVTCPQCGAATQVPGPEVVAAARANLQGMAGGAASLQKPTGGAKPAGTPGAPPPVPGRQKPQPNPAVAGKDTPPDRPISQPGPVGGTKKVAENAPPTASPDRTVQPRGNRPQVTPQKPPPLPPRGKLPSGKSTGQNSTARPDARPKKLAGQPLADAAPAGPDAAVDAAGDDQRRNQKSERPSKRAAAGTGGGSRSGTKPHHAAAAEVSAKYPKSKKSRWRGEPDQQGDLPDGEDSGTSTSFSTVDSVVHGPSTEGADDPAKKDAGSEGTVAARSGRPQHGSTDERARRPAANRRKTVDLMADTAELEMAPVSDGGASAPAESPVREADQGSPPSGDLDAASADGPDSTSASDSESVVKSGPEPAAAERPASDAAEADVRQPDAAATVDAAFAAATPVEESSPAASSTTPPASAAIPAAQAATPVSRAATPPVRPVADVSLSPEEEPPVAAPSEPATEPKPAPVGIVHPQHKRHTVYYVAAAMVFVALVSMGPALREFGLHLLDENSPGIGPWAPFMLLLSFVQLAYVVYVVQLPDWGSTRVMMVLTVIVAMVYAAGLGFAATTGADNEWLLVMGYSRQQMIAWCLLILLLMCGLAYVWARVTFKWQRDYRNTAMGRN